MILIAGLLINWTAFSQSIKADKKIDSFYCFGPVKAKELVKMQKHNWYCDSTNIELMQELDLCQYAIDEQKAVISDQSEYINASDSIVVHKNAIIKIAEDGEMQAKKQLKKQKNVNVFERITLAVSLAINVLFTLKK